VTQSKTLIRIALWAVGYLAAFGACVPAGFYVGAYVRHDNAFRADPSDLDHQAALLELRVDPSHEQARLGLLLAYLALLDSDAPKSRSAFSSYLAADKALTLARLSSAARGLGQQEASRRYMDRALELCGEMKWSQCDEERLADGATKMNRAYSDFYRPPK
jgi:hypothetical protein